MQPSRSPSTACPLCMEIIRDAGYFPHDQVKKRGDGQVIKGRTIQGWERRKDQSSLDFVLACHSFLESSWLGAHVNAASDGLLLSHNDATCQTFSQFCWSSLSPEERMREMDKGRIQMKGEEEKEENGEIQKGFLSRMHSMTIKTKQLKGEKTCFYAKQLVQQQGFTFTQSSSLAVNPAESLLVAAFHILCFCLSSYSSTLYLSIRLVLNSW